MNGHANGLQAPAMMESQALCHMTSTKGSSRNAVGWLSDYYTICHWKCAILWLDCKGIKALVKLYYGFTTTSFPRSHVS
jgi:hypothetical protein